MLSRLRLSSSIINKINKNISSNSIGRSSSSITSIFNNNSNSTIIINTPIDITKSYTNTYINRNSNSTSTSSIIYNTMNNIINNIKNTIVLPLFDHSSNDIFNGIMMSSVVKKRRMKMNKHKLKKRRKLNRMNTKQSRG